MQTPDPQEQKLRAAVVAAEKRAGAAREALRAYLDGRKVSREAEREAARKAADRDKATKAAKERKQAAAKQAERDRKRQVAEEARQAAELARQAKQAERDAKARAKAEQAALDDHVAGGGDVWVMVHVPNLGERIARVEGGVRGSPVRLRVRVPSVGRGAGRLLVVSRWRPAVGRMTLAAPT